MELDERSRLGRRTVLADGARLLRWASEGSARASGFEPEVVRRDEVLLDARDPALALGAGADPADLAMFAGHPGAVTRVRRDGEVLAEGGRHRDWEAIAAAAEAALRRVLAS